MILSDDQEVALEHVRDWLKGATEPFFEQIGKRNVTVGTSHGYPVCAVGGYAGTGKTTILRCLAESSPQGVLLTPTHKAAQVLRSKLPQALRPRVRTFHSLIYMPDPKFTCKVSGGRMSTVDSGDENAPDLEPCSYHAMRPEGYDGSMCDPQEELKFTRREYIDGLHNLIIVDEASMLTEQEVEDLRSYGLPVLLVGDHGQLPPVKAKMNRWIAEPDVVLTVNHRQGEASGIPEAADDARLHGKLRKSSYGNACVRLDASSQAASGLLGRFRPDAREAAFIVQYNKTRAALNMMFHQQLHPRPPGAQTHVLAPGERIISLGRQEEAQEVDEHGSVINEMLLHNGTLATVLSVLSNGPEYMMITAELDEDWRGRTGTRVLLSVATKQFGNPEQLSYRHQPPGAALWDYAYALTAHKAQGSEFDNVIVWQETPGDKRWLYTAVTRARKALIVLDRN